MLINFLILNTMSDQPKEENNKKNINRRDVLKGLATLPAVGLLSAGALSYGSSALHHESAEIASDLNLQALKAPAVNTRTTGAVAGDNIRIGIIGSGSRGMQLLRALGFADQEWVKNNTKNGNANVNVKRFLAQENLNVRITAICDTFSIYAQNGADAVMNGHRVAADQSRPEAPRLYHNYLDMLHDGNVDAVVIATPDHWHAQMSIDAARAGKHVYCEKPMTRTIEEAKNLRDVIRETGVTFQLGHQNRQQASYMKAREVVDHGLLGHISMVETYTNRNSDHGAWIRGIHPKADRNNIHWEGFLGDAPYVPFDLDRYFNWQKWFEYGGSVAGNQFTHEYDCINQILGLGIPSRVVALGGTFYYDDARTIPDVFNAIFEYPDRKLTLTYDCSLKSAYSREKLIMGDDASMVISINLGVFPDRNSDKYKKYKVNPETPIFSYDPKDGEVDAVTSATARYYQERGFGYTYRNGERIDCTYLHMLEWVNCIRNEATPSCDVQQGFEESVTYIMSNDAYLENRSVRWDADQQQVV